MENPKTPHHPGTTWWSEQDGGDGDMLVAYFSMEFGVDVSLPIYSGGLGVLAGDHLKAAAELGLPLVGVGLLYRGGYFTQGLDDEGARPRRTRRSTRRRSAWSASRSPSRSTSRDSRRGGVWRYDVGSVPLYLLDVDWLTDALYCGDREHRIRQELLLGVGGVRALAALGIEPPVFHVNEGHSAFLAIERARMLVESGLSTAQRSSTSADHGLHDSHAGAGRQRALRRRARPALRRRARRAAPASRPTTCSASAAPTAPTDSA